MAGIVAENAHAHDLFSHGERHRVPHRGFEGNAQAAGDVKSLHVIRFQRPRRGHAHNQVAIVHAYPDSIGRIRIQARLYAGGILELVVRDWGVGIADVDEARRPMFTTGGEERSGMGFTIMESFMDSLRVRSAPGKGTVVTMKRKIALRGGEAQ